LQEEFRYGIDAGIGNSMVPAAPIVRDLTKGATAGGEATDPRSRIFSTLNG
jgi:hypothetical protein